MEQWYRLPLGAGASQFQTLREVRNCRLAHDQGSGPESVFPTFLDLETVSLWLYLPPGNDALASELQAVPCDAPEQAAGQMVRMSEEYHPARPPERLSEPEENESQQPLPGLDFP